MKPNLISLELSIAWFNLLNWYDAEYGTECPKTSTTWITDYLSMN